MRALLGIVAAAVVTAAALRHIFHVHVGLSREAIRGDALTAAAIIVALIAIEFIGRRWRRTK
jgi:hypothetical protein